MHPSTLASVLRMGAGLGLVLVACGGRVISIGVDGSSPSPEASDSTAGDGAESADGAEGGSADGEGTVTDPDGYCVYQTCMGLSLCGVGKTCPVGDGCNSCTCSSLGGDLHSSSCTSNACSCR